VTEHPAQPDLRDQPLGELFGRLSSDLSTLVRQELALARAELTEKGREAGKGAGLFGGAGVVALLGLNALITCVVLALGNVMPGWLAAIVVAVVLFAVAGVLALIGRKDVRQAAPPLPTETIASVRADIATVRDGVDR
jgi:uncharacterized membrane protein YqjE